MRDRKSLLAGLVAGLILGVIIAVLALVLSRPIRPAAIEIQAPQSTAPLPAAPPLATETPGLIHVFVSGAVAVSDVYELPPGSLVKDAIIMAGGFTADANPFVLNQALTVKDGDHIHVPTLEETAVTPPLISGGVDAPIRAPDMGDAVVGPLININTASQAELESLPGIGPALALNIIDYRETSGPFQKIEDIILVSGIGTAKFEAMQPFITVGN